MKWNEESESVQEVRRWRKSLQAELEKIPPEKRSAWMEEGAQRFLEEQGIKLPRKGVSKPNK